MISEERSNFPLLVNNQIAYLDSGATSQKPQSVIDAISQFYQHENANVHRGVYRLSALATHHFESVRKKVQQFIHAASEKEIIFTKGTTDAINLVASSFGEMRIKSGDEIVITAMEHHSNIVPWQLLCERIGAKLQVIPVADDGTLNLDNYQNMLSEKTRLVALIHVSNVLGTINPVKQMIQTAHAKNIPVLLDGAQAVAHLPVDVMELDCDFYTFSAHKLYGSTGVGVLYGKKQWLQSMPPYQAGGDMIRSVTFEKTTFNELPYKFEAGTPNIAGVIALGAAIDYVASVGFENIITHEQHLLAYTTEKLAQIPNLTIIGNAAQKIGVVSFVLDQVHAHDIGTILDNENVAIRVGHHCAMPLMERFKVAATARVSLGIYNNIQDIDRLIQALEKVIAIFSTGGALK